MPNLAHLSPERTVTVEGPPPSPFDRHAGLERPAFQHDPAYQDLAATLDRPRTWTINGRFLTQSTTGVQRYGREIVQALDALLGDGHPAGNGLSLELLIPGEHPAPPLQWISVRRTRSVPGHVWEQIVLPAMARGGILSLCNTSTMVRRKQIVCVHDLNFMAFPRSYSLAFRALYRLVVPQVLRVSAGVATVSHYSAGQLAQAGLAASNRICVAPNGHEHVRRWRGPRTAGRECRVDRNTVVVIGSTALHKNVGLIIGLSQQLGRHGLRVAVVGGFDAKVFRRADASFDNETITWLGFVPDEELAVLYENCLCLAFPSRAEGFGLPPLEAMALGCPVVSSDTTSLPEVCGDAALYAAPDDPDAWIRAFLLIKSDPHLRARLIDKGLRRAAQFSWRATAESYLQLMLRIDRAQSTRRRPIGPPLGGKLLRRS